MSPSDAGEGIGSTTFITAFRERVAEQCANSDVSDDELLGSVLALAVRAYVARREAGGDPAIFAEEELTATEVAVVTTAMLDAVDLEVFELGMWASLGAI